MRLSALAAALLLAACSSTQSTQYFVLPDSQYIQPNRPGNEVAVKVFLSQALDNGALVYQTDAHHVHFAKNHLWANPLDSALANHISNKLNRLSPQQVFVPAGRSKSSRQLKVYVEAFQGSHEGKTIVSGYALWPNGSSKPFHAETAQAGDGYAAMVTSLAAGLEQAAQEMLE